MLDLKEILRAEIELFRENGHRFINKELTVAEFKTKSGGMGAYAQRGGEKFMIRLRIPCGVLSIDHLRLTESFLKIYGVNKIHLTTRQAIQIHDLDIDDVCDIMKECLKYDLYTRGGGGNFPRNVTLSPLSGVEKNEAFDVTPYAILVNDYFMKQMNTYNLPRKLKVGFSNSSFDHANVTLTDLGFMACIKDNKKYFKIYLAGGLGKNPSVGILYDELVEPKDILYHVEAITQLFISEGDYSNKNKARIRYIAQRMGNEEFIKCYKKHLEKVKNEMQLNFIENNSFEVNLSCNTDKDLEENNCLIKQKQSGLYTVVIHPLNGQLYINDLNDIIDFVSKDENIQMRLSMTESLYIRNLNSEQATNLLKLTNSMRQKTKLQKSVPCIGVPTCQMGIERSQNLMQEILIYFKEKDVINYDILPSIHISGCTNSCSRHQVNQIGFAGKKKKINDTLEDAFEIHIAGKFSETETYLGKVYGDILSRRIPEFLFDLFCKLKENNKDFITYYNEQNEDFKELIKDYIV